MVVPTTSKQTPRTLREFARTLRAGNLFKTLATASPVIAARW
jgi:hypothetical protein